MTVPTQDLVLWKELLDVSKILQSEELPGASAFASVRSGSTKSVAEPAPGDPRHLPGLARHTPATRDGLLTSGKIMNASCLTRAAGLVLVG